jgi:UDP-3-O-[3-hydroxymyristoyl] glucosamine N-acyltransferase
MRLPWFFSLVMFSERGKLFKRDGQTFTFQAMSFTANQIAELLKAEVIGDGSTRLTGLAPADCARAGELTFAEKETHFAAAQQSQAAAILVSEVFAPSTKVLIRVRDARVAMARVLPAFFPPDQWPSGIHPSAVIDGSAQIDPTAHIGPNCVVGARVRLGARSVLLGGNHIGADCQMGEDVCLFPNVVVYARTQIGHRVSIHAGTVIGSDGYGYVFDEGRHRKVLQIGNVIIGDDVEIGANSAIDRGALGSTVIGQGTKIDNLVHVAHNVVMGRHCLIMGQVGFAGSTHLGDYCVVASQSGIAGHLKLGNQAVVGAKSGVMRDIPAGGRVLGIPAAPDKQAKRQMIAVQQLPDMIHRLRELEKQVEQLQAKIGI